MDQMNKNFNETKPGELVHNGQNYMNLPNVTPQPPTKFEPPRGGSDFVLKGKDGKEYLMPMWTFISTMDNADKNAIKNQNRVDFLANVVSDLKEKIDVVNGNMKKAIGGLRTETEEKNGMIVNELRNIIKTTGETQRRVNSLESQVPELKQIIENVNRNMKNINKFT